MTITLEITPEVAKIVKARAIARGVSLDVYLPPIIAQIAQQEEWAELPQEESPATSRCLPLNRDWPEFGTRLKKTRPGNVWRRTMKKFKRGDIVLLPFPFSDATGAKMRPSLVLAELPYYGSMDYLVCMISSQNTSDPQSTEILPSDLTAGRLSGRSDLRPLYLLGADGSVIVRRIAMMNLARVDGAAQVIAGIVSL